MARLLSAVQSLEVVHSNSMVKLGVRGLSIVWRSSISWRVRYGGGGGSTIITLALTIKCEKQSFTSQGYMHIYWIVQ